MGEKDLKVFFSLSNELFLIEYKIVIAWAIGGNTSITLLIMSPSCVIIKIFLIGLESSYFNKITFLIKSLELISP